jgi:hypothetical protein
MQAGIGAGTTKSNCEHVYKRSSSILRLVWNSYGMQLALTSSLKLGWDFALPQGCNLNQECNRIAKQALQSKSTE